MTPSDITAHLHRIGLPHMAEEVRALAERADSAESRVADLEEAIEEDASEAALRDRDRWLGRSVMLEAEMAEMRARLEAAEALAEAVRGRVVGEVLGILRSRLHEDGALDEAPHETDDLLARIAALTSPPSEAER